MPWLPSNAAAKRLHKYTVRLPTMNHPASQRPDPARREPAALFIVEASSRVPAEFAAPRRTTAVLPVFTGKTLHVQSAAVWRRAIRKSGRCPQTKGRIATTIHPFTFRTGNPASTSRVSDSAASAPPRVRACTIPTPLTPIASRSPAVLSDGKKLADRPSRTRLCLRGRPSAMRHTAFLRCTLEARLIRPETGSGLGAQFAPGRRSCSDFSASWH